MPESLPQCHNPCPFSDSKNVMAAVAAVGRKRSSRNGSCDDSSGGGGGESDHEMHIWTERERRKKMRNMFSHLHALLPQLPSKIDKSTIVDEAVKYIKTLQENLKRMQKRKLEKLSTTRKLANSRESVLVDHKEPSKSFVTGCKVPPSVHVPPSSCPARFRTWFSPNVVLNMCGHDAQISVCAVRKPGLLSSIFYIMEKHRLDVVSAHICSDQYRSMYMIHARTGGVWKQNQEAFSAEEIFKLAVGEMNLGLLSFCYTKINNKNNV